MTAAWLAFNETNDEFMWQAVKSKLDPATVLGLIQQAQAIRDSLPVA